MKNLIVTVLFALPFIGFAQTPTQTENYILNTTYQKGYEKGQEQYALPAEKIITIGYFDGLGRPIQNISIGSGGQQQDIVTHIDYDEFGRQIKEYLPFTVQNNSGTYRINGLIDTKSYYNQIKFEEDFIGMSTTTINPYSEILLESSPLNEVEKQAAPGADWKLGTGHEIVFNYETNIGSEVRQYGVNLVYNSSQKIYTSTLTIKSSNNGKYEANELYKTVTKDENWTSGTAHTIEEFKDKQDRVILKRTYGASDINGDGDTVDGGESNAPHDTYYIYDNYGNLTYVLPPKMEGSNNNLTTIQNQLNELGYQYNYDNRNRLVEKKIPGKDLEYIVYDNLDRVVLTQDANQRTEEQWMFIKYDVFGRIAYTGIYETSSSRYAIQQEFNSKNVLEDNYETKVASGSGYGGNYYSNSDYPVITSPDDILTVNYYDDYTFDKDGLSLPNSYEGQTIINYDNNASTKILTKGLPTGNKVRVLTTSIWITTISGYDTKNRVIYTATKNPYLGTTDIIKDELDFVGKVDKKVSEHSKTDKATIITEDNFAYDHNGRLLTLKQKINNNSSKEELIVENSYDDLGQLVSKGIGNLASNSTTRLQTVDYKYNIRRWLKQINNPASLGNKLFALKINYNSVDHGGTKLYNGNISETEWRTNNDDNSLHWYKFQYDALNRITNATDDLNRYSINTVSYDKNGNLTRLKRLGHIVEQPNRLNSLHFGVMDYLDYNYFPNTNKLQNVQELSGGHATYGFKNASSVSTEYMYNTNGSITQDLNKGIPADGITYNHLNLPTMVQFGSVNKIEYFYDATGEKLKKEVTENSNIVITTEYDGNHIYKKVDSGDNELQFFNTLEGYVTPVNAANYNSGFKYIYQYKDHLGNIRLSYSDSDGNGIISITEIIEENNYYPFGLKHQGYNTGVSANGNSSAQKFKYNGIEYEDNTGLYEMDIRSYDPAIARFTSIDPVTHFNYSPYTAFDNNPVFWADPSGADSQTIQDLDGNHWVVDCENGKCGNETRKDPKEGETQEVERVVDKRGNSTLETEYYHSGGFEGSTPGWKTEREYLVIIRSISGFLASMDKGLIVNKGSIEWLNNVHAVEGLSALLLHYSSILVQRETARKIYSASGHTKSMGIDSPFFIVGGLANVIRGFSAKEALKKTITPLGRGSTGRVFAKNLKEQLVMSEIMENPSLGRVIMRGKSMSDSRWSGWKKMSWNNSGVEIHYVGKIENGVLKAVDDFKFTN